MPAKPRPTTKCSDAVNLLWSLSCMCGFHTAFGSLDFRCCCLCDSTISMHGHSATFNHILLQHGPCMTVTITGKMLEKLKPTCMQHRLHLGVYALAEFMFMLESLCNTLGTSSYLSWQVWGCRSDGPAGWQAIQVGCHVCMLLHGSSLQ